MKTDSVQELTQKIWRMADILRGSMAIDDAVDYILSLTSLKWLSDTSIEEGKKAQNVTGSHHFVIPESARWENIQKVDTQVGEVLNKASKELEGENTYMEGIFSSIDFTSHKLGDVEQRDATLRRLVHELSGIDMGEKSHVDCDDLFEIFARGIGKGGRRYHRTPRDVVKLVVALLGPQEGMGICDPACRFGEMLTESARYVKQSGGDPQKLSLYGQEMDIGAWRICKMNMLLHGFLDADIKLGNVIWDPKTISDGQLMRFDMVLATPPFTSDQLRRGELEKDRFGRFRYGIPPRKGHTFAFVEHMIATRGQKGKLGTIVPYGILFRSGPEASIRKAILEEDIVEAVIGLPPNLFFATTIPTVVLIINKNKPSERKGSLLVIDASNECSGGRVKKTLQDDNIEKIVDAYNSYEDVENFCRVVPISEIRDNDYNLNISGYVEILPEEVTVDIESVLRELRELRDGRREIEKKMDMCLEVLGYNA